MPKFLAESAADTPPTRNMSWLVLVTSGLVAALLIGSAHVSVPDSGLKIADVQPVQSERAQNALRSVETPKLPVEKETADASTPGREAPPVAQEPERDLTPASGLAFRNAAACTDATCVKLLGDVPRPVAPTAVDPALGVAVGILYATRPDGRDAAMATSGPIETVTVSAGTGSRSTAPTPPVVGSSEPALPIPLGNLGEVEIVLVPRDGTDTARAKVSLRERDGREIAAFELKVDHALVVGASEALAEDDDAPKTEPPDQAADERKPDVAVTPAMPHKATGTEKAKTTTRRAKSAQKTKSAASPPARTPTQQAPSAPPPPAAPPPRGLFTLDTPAQPAAAPPAPKSPVVSPSDIASQPTPRTIDRPPGFETLMGLGGGFALEQP